MWGDVQEPETRGGTTGDERARDREVLHPRVGVFDHSGAYARTVLCLTLGGLQTVRTGEGAEANGASRHPSPSADTRVPREQLRHAICHAFSGVPLATPRMFRPTCSPKKLQGAIAWKFYEEDRVHGI